METPAKILVKEVEFAYELPAKNGRLSVLKSVTFGCEPTKIVAVVGPSGCGKSTLLNIIAGLLRPTGGQIEFPDSLGGNPRRTAYVFQSPRLVPWLSVRHNALLGAELGGILTSQLERRCNEHLSAYGLTGFENSLPHTLSGGMQQRVALLRALLSNAKVLLLDEPYANSDFVLRRQLQMELSEAVTRDKLVAILVTHDLTEAARTADEVVVLSERPAEVVDTFHIPIPRAARLKGEADAIRDLAEYLSRLERAVSDSQRAQKGFAS
ncbi:MAG: ABC transporter ATP-binding protein [Methylocella sp.]